MKHKIVLAVLALILAAVACDLPGSSAPAVTVTIDPTPEPHDPVTTSTPTLPPTEANTATPTEIETGGETDSEKPIVYADRSVDPPEAVFLDPVDGEEIRRIAAPNLGFSGTGGVTTSGIFYLGSEYQQAYRLHLDGTLQELLFLNPDGGSFEGVILPSPDGLRIAHGAILSYDASGGRAQLKVVNVDGTGERILLDEMLTERPLRPSPVMWSNDGDYVYYMNVIEGIEGYGGTSLYRVEIATGDSETIFTPLNGLFSTSVSPDETKAVRVVMDTSLTLVIQDLNSGEEEMISFASEFQQGWQIVWAPDSSVVLVTLGLGLREEDTFSIVRVDPETLDTSFLVRDDDRLLRPVAWHVMETIWMNDRDGNLWRLLEASGEMTLIEPDARILPYSK